MGHSWHAASSRPHGQQPLLWPPPQRWNRPTFGEFLERVEHEFGASIDLTGLQLLGLGHDEPLTPSDIEALCSQLGVPPEDFGVGP